jgi:YD repeat-containing protein
VADDASVLASTLDPDGRPVDLTEERWQHIVAGHPELRPHLQSVMAAVRNPDRRMAGRSAAEEWFYLEGAGPSSLAQSGRTLRERTWANRHFVRSEIHAMTLTIGSITFDHVSYDRDADVLYLSVGDPERAVEFDESAEGHALRYDSDGRLVGVTIVGAGRLLEEQGSLVVTPPQLRVDGDDLAAVLAAA